MIDNQPSVPPRVLDVGNCNHDHGQISRMLADKFGATAVVAHTAQDALDILVRERFDLVLVNRKLDSDYSDGMEVIRRVKKDAALAAIPIMLVTNYAEHQAQAVAEGALPGFGKLELNSSTTHQRLAEVFARAAT